MCADLNQDKKSDIVVSNMGSGSVTVLKNVGPGCCVGFDGNTDCDPANSVDIADLTVLVDHLFISFDELCCEAEADMVADSSVDIADLTALVDHLFISFAPLSVCE